MKTLNSILPHPPCLTCQSIFHYENKQCIYNKANMLQNCRLVWYHVRQLSHSRPYSEQLEQEPWPVMGEATRHRGTPLSLFQVRIQSSKSKILGQSASSEATRYCGTPLSFSQVRIQTSESKNFGQKQQDIVECQCHCLGVVFRAARARSLGNPWGLMLE